MNTTKIRALTTYSSHVKPKRSINILKLINRGQFLRLEDEPNKNHSQLSMGFGKPQNWVRIAQMQQFAKQISTVNPHKNHGNDNRHCNHHF